MAPLVHIPQRVCHPTPYYPIPSLPHTDCPFPQGPVFGTPLRTKEQWYGRGIDPLSR